MVVGKSANWYVDLNEWLVVYLTLLKLHNMSSRQARY